MNNKENDQFKKIKNKKYKTEKIKTKSEKKNSFFNLPHGSSLKEISEVHRKEIRVQ